jgi:hypothetical protein
MVDVQTFKHLALSFPDVVEQPHFEKVAFKVNKKRIFATLAVESSMACVKLSEIEQSVFCTFDNTVIFPVNNKWGKQGWTFIDLKKVRKGMLKDALKIAYEEALKPKQTSQK